MITRKLTVTITKMITKMISITRITLVIWAQVEEAE